MTPANKRLSSIRNNLAEVDCEALCDLWQKEREESVVLYRLNDDMYDYIKVLTNELRHVIANDLYGILNQPVTVDSYEESTILSEILNMGEED